MIEVHKFGGSSQTELGYHLISQMDTNIKKVIVVSAISNVTNLLLEYVETKDDNLKQHIININQSFADRLDVNIIDIMDYFKDLTTNIESNKREIVGYGEHFTANILSRYLNNNSIDAITVMNTLVIKSDKENSDKLYNNGSFSVDMINISNAIMSSNTVIIPGFGGRDINNEFCLMGRGGSDTTGAIIASAIDANKYYIWTDVNGLYTIDPNINSKARLISNIDYYSAQELAAMGAKVVHPYCILPCAKKNIPIIIKNTFNSYHDNNTIISDIDNIDSVIYSTTRQKNITYFKITSLNMWNNYGFVTDIFNTFSKLKIDVNIINTSQFSISTTTDETDMFLLQKAINCLGENYKVEMETNLELVSVVGMNIHINNKLDDIFSIVKNKPIIMTSYSSNDRTISFLIRPDNNNMINLIHDKLFGFKMFDSFIDDKLKKNISNIKKEAYYYYDMDKLNSNILLLKSLQNIDSIHYAVKANHNINILKYISNYLDFECVSLEEIKKVRSISNNHISFTPNFCKISDYIDAYSYNNIDIVIDNIDIILKYGNIFEGKKLGLRIDFNMGHGHHMKVITQGNDSKFGITINDFIKNISIFERHNITINGLHTHMGSGVVEDKFWIDLMDKMIELIDNNIDIFKNLEYINIGGGFGIQKEINFERFDRNLKIRKSILQNMFERDIPFRIEPGRFIVGNIGYLVGKVTQIKTKGNTKFIGCNIGMNDNMRPALYDSVHEIEFITQKFNSIEKEIINVVGPICESGDIFVKNMLTTQDIRYNDIIVIKNCGAYVESMASTYNCREVLPVILSSEVDDYSMIDNMILQDIGL